MIENIFNRNKEITFIKLDKLHLINWTEHLYRALFSIGDENCSMDGLKLSFAKSQFDLELILKAVITNADLIKQISSKLYNKIDKIHEMLLGDLNTIYAFDPAAKNKSEIIFSYPGFYAISIYRISHELWLNEVPVIPRIISEYVHNKTGIDIHPGATIGEKFFIDHGTGIVIGETTTIGNNVKIYQGVTLGALNIKKEEAEIKRHPTIEDDVVIYANATILGGNTIVGKNSVIGGNVWISNSVPSNSMVFKKSEIIIKDNKIFPEPLNYII